MMQGGVALVIPGVHVCAQFFDQKLDGGEHAPWREPMRVGGEPFAVPDAGGGEQWWNPRAAGRKRRQTRRVLRIVAAARAALTQAALRRLGSRNSGIGSV